jgi:HlyD family secretion protein
MTAGSAISRDALVDELAGPAIRSTRLTGRVVWALFLVLLALAAFAPVSSGIVAAGHLAPETSRQVVQHSTGGVIAEIRVKDGQEVSAGEVLIRLAGIEESAAAGIASAEIFALRVEERVRAAEAEGVPSLALTSDLEQGARTNPEWSPILESQRSVFETRQARLAATTKQIDSRRGQLRQSMASAEARLRSAREQLTLVEGEAADLRRLFEKGLVTRNRVLALERAAAELGGATSALEADIRRYGEEDTELSAQRSQVLLDARTEAAEALRSVQADLAAAGYRSVAAEDALAHVEVRAPVSGSIVGLRVTTIGGVVAAGEPIMEILPKGDQLLVRTRLRPQDADDVREGARATVSFDLLNSGNTPRVTGSVIHVSRDALQDDRNGEAYFEARVEIPLDEARRLPPHAFAPGLPAEVLIHSGSNSVLGYLMAPFERVAFNALREP